MKISTLHVRGFGKIEDFSITLSSGLNVIYGPNESGKSTLMAFIKASLYGLKGGRASKEGLVAESKRYMPWNNGAFGGYISFELDNRSSYRIDRAFDSGVVKLYDESFNDITSLFADSKDGSGISERLIGLGESLFDRTVYIKQLGTRIDNAASKDLIDRISNIRQSGSEDISYKKANAALKEALKQQVGTDRSYTRPLDIINKRLEELNLIKNRIQKENKELLDTRIKQEELAKQINRLSSKEILFAKLIEFCQLKERVKHQYEKNEELLFVQEEIKKVQNNINIMSKDITELDIEIDNNSKQLALLSEQQAISDQSEHQQRLEKEKVWCKNLNIYIIIALIAFIGAGFGAFVVRVISPGVAGILSLIALALVVLKLKSTRAVKGLELVLKEFYENSNKSKNQLSNFQRIDQILQQQRVNLNNRIVNEKNQYEKLIKRLENQNTNLEQRDIVALEKELDGVCETISELRLAVKLSLTRAENDIVINIIENNSQDQLTNITELKQFVITEIQQKKLENATLEATIKKSGVVQNEELVEGEIASLTQQKRQLEQRGEALSIAIKILEEATNDVQKKYIPVMNKVFRSTFSGLTTRKYSDIRAGENLNIMLSDPNTQTIVPVNLLSSGTIDQLYLALRIAISETVLKINEGLPFIMDEPFAQYDDTRTDNALRCIYDISKKQQVIIFTCKQREVDLIKNQYSCNICSLT